MTSYNADVVVENVDAVLAVLAEREQFHIVELAVELLRLCRRDSTALRTCLLEPRHIRERKQMRAHVAKLIRDRALLDADDASALRQLAVRATADSVPDIVIARGIAEGLDFGAGQHFADWFTEDQILRPHDPFPVPPNRVHCWVHKPSGNPDTRTEAIDRLDRLRLVPADTRGVGISVRRPADLLASIEHVERFGIAVIEAPDRIEADFEWERYTLDDEKLFFGVRHTSPNTVQERIQQAVEAALEHQVDLLLLPELCMTEAMHERLVDSDAFRSIPFVVAGSYHTPAAVGPGTNQTTLFARGQPVATHTKFRPVIFHDARNDDGTRADKRIPRQEHLQSMDARITLLATDHFSVAVLICKDAMENAVGDLLRDLAVQLVLVPAMSPKVEDFVRLANDLGGDPQSFTLVANLGETVAIIGRPTERDRVQMHAYDGFGLKVFDREARLLIK